MFTRGTHLYNRHPDQHIKYTSIPKVPLNTHSFISLGQNLSRKSAQTYHGIIIGQVG